MPLGVNMINFHCSRSWAWIWAYVGCQSWLPFLLSHADQGSCHLTQRCLFVNRRIKFAFKNEMRHFPRTSRVSRWFQLLFGFCHWLASKLRCFVDRVLLDFKSLVGWKIHVLSQHSGKDSRPVFYPGWAGSLPQLQSISVIL